MIAAEQKRRENIAEYIIYMYQTEDLIRSYDLDLERIDANLIRHYPISEEEKTALKEWYAQCIHSMKQEGLEDSGHLQSVEAITMRLVDLSKKLYAEDTSYQEIYEQARPYIDKHMKEAGGAIQEPVQLCLNGLYGLMLLRLHQKPVSEEQQEAVQHFGKVLRYLSDRYKETYD